MSWVSIKTKDEIPPKIVIINTVNAQPNPTQTIFLEGGLVGDRPRIEMILPINNNIATPKNTANNKPQGPMEIVVWNP